MVAQHAGYESSGPSDLCYVLSSIYSSIFFFQAEDGIRDGHVTGVQTCALPISTKRIAFYHGGMEPIDRIAIQQQFMNDQLDIICCTSAFGMGINKNNIRLIIHFH